MAVSLTILSHFDDRGVARAQRSLAKFGSEAKGFAGSTSANLIKAGASIAVVGRATASVGDSLTRGVTLPLAAAGAFAWKFGAEFQGSMTQVQAASDATAGEMAQLTAEAKKIGTTTMFSAQEASQAMLELAKSGITPAQMKAGALASTMKLAAAGGLNLENAAATTANALGMFGLKAADAAQVANALAGGANASSASVESLCQGLAQVGPGARNAGLSLQETTGVLSAFASKGIQGSDAGTSLKTMLTRLVPTTDKAAKAMKQYGLNFVDAKGQMLPIADVAQQLQDKLGGLSEAERTQALATLFGSDATRAATVLMQEGKKGVEAYTKATTDKAAASKMAAAIENSDAGRTKKMQATLATTAITIQSALAPAVISAAEAVSNLARWFSNLSPSTQNFIVKAGLVAAVMGPVLSIFGRLVATAGGVIGAIGKIGLAMGTNAAAAPAWARAVAKPLGAMKTAAIGAAGGLKTAARAVATGAAGAVSAAARWTAQTAALIAHKVAAVAAAVASKAMAAGQAILNAVMSANPIAIVIIAIAGLVAALIVAYKKSETFRKIVDKAWSAIKRVTSIVFGFIARFIMSAVNRIRSHLYKISAIVSAVIGFFGRLLSGIKEKIGKVIEFCRGIKDKIKNAIGDVGRVLYDKGAALVRGFGNGIESMIGWLKEKARKILEIVKQIIGAQAKGAAAKPGDVRTGAPPAGPSRSSGPLSSSQQGIDLSSGSSIIPVFNSRTTSTSGAPGGRPAVSFAKGAVQINFTGGTSATAEEVERAIGRAMKRLAVEIGRA